MNENRDVETAWYFAKTRVSRTEYLEFLKVLQSLGTTCSRFFRKVIREVIGEGPDLLAHELKLFREALYQVAALGRNLNQLLKAFHTGQPPGILVDQAALAAFRDQVEQLKQALVTVILRSKHRWVLSAGSQMKHG